MPNPCQLRATSPSSPRAASCSGSRRPVGQAPLLIIIKEVGYQPFEQGATNLSFQLVSSRYEHASLILTSNLSFARWGDVFGGQTVAAAMIDRIVHHADVHTLKGGSYRLKHITDEILPSVRRRQNRPNQNVALLFEEQNRPTTSERRHSSGCRLAVGRPMQRGGAMRPK